MKVPTQGMTCACVFLSLRLLAQVPVAGPNVNMVSGTTWPDGDPFLQRQNEPSIAVSTRNPSHLLAGANDYRTVDLAISLSVLNSADPDAQLVGDAWLGVFKSSDGGQKWRSNLLPGCRYAVAQCQQAPALSTLAYQAGADPVVRAGPNGMFFYSSIAFDRNHSRSALVLTRFIDDNNREGVTDDPIRYLDTNLLDQDASGQFIDKPWIAVDIPRGGTATCSIPASGNGPAQSFPAFNVYVAYARFTGTNNSAQIYVAVSKDCGVTWNKSVKVSPGTSKPQGSTITIDPNSGAVYLAWRQFQLLTTQPDAMKVVKSTDAGNTFGSPVVVSNIIPFDLSVSTTGIRTLSFPSLAVDQTGLVYMVWAARQTAGGDARIMLSTSPDGATWSAPQMVEPPPPLYDNSFLSPVQIQPGTGHQFMPSINIANGKIVVAYYSLYEDATIGELLCPPGLSGLCNSIAQYLEFRKPNPLGNLYPAPPSGTQLSSVFASGINDGSGLTRRHTMDVRVALAATGANPAFSVTRLSQYLYGSPDSAGQSEKTIQQLRFNVLNLPLFVGGTEPFVGDYLDVAPQTIVPGATAGTWTYNTSPSVKPQWHAVWTDNRDVRPPADGNWQNYTPIPLSGYTAGQLGNSCSPGQAGMRNQNIYSSRVTEGLLVTVPGNSKQLNTTFPRAFSVVVQNSTDVVKTYRLTIANQPPGGQASFQQTSLATQIDASAAPLSSLARNVFVTSSVATAQVTVSVVEITSPGGTVVSGGQQTSVVLNPDSTNPPLTTPDMTIVTEELYVPDLTNPDLTNPDLTNPDLTNPDLTNNSITTPDLTNPDLTNPDLTNPDLTNPGIAAPDLTNPDLTNPDLTNPDLTNPDLTNQTLTDLNYTVTNTGNTTTTFKIRLVTPQGQASIPANYKLQLVLHKVYATPQVELLNSPATCELIEDAQTVLVSSFPLPSTGNAVIVSPTSPDLTSPDLTNPDQTNATLTLAPGEKGYVTLRIQAPTGVTQQQVAQFAVSTIQPAAVAGAVSTNLPAGSPPAIAVGTSSFVYAGNLNNISGFSVNAVTGALTAVPGSPFASGNTPFSMAADPKGRFLYESNTGDNTVSAYTINGVTGALTPVPGSPFPAGSFPSIVAVDATGSFVYVTNQNSSNISAYTVNATTGALTAVPGSPFSTGSVPYFVAVDPTSRFLYVTSFVSGNVAAFTIDAGSGALTAVPGSPFPAGPPDGPTGIAFDPAGKFAYVANYASNNVWAYTINSSTGALTAIAGSPSAAGFAPAWVTIDPTGQFLYSANQLSNDVSGYTINASTGALTSIPGSPFAAGSGADSVAVDSTGRFVYVSDFNANSVSAYTINGATGALTAVPASPFSSGGSGGNGPFPVVVVPARPLGF